MGQDRLNSLELLAIEMDISRKIDLEAAVDRVSAVDKAGESSLTSEKVGN